MNKSESMTKILEAIRAKGYEGQSAYVYFFGMATIALTEKQIKEIEKSLGLMN